MLETVFTRFRGQKSLLKFFLLEGYPTISLYLDLTWLSASIYVGCMPSISHKVCHSSHKFFVYHKIKLSSRQSLPDTQPKPAQVSADPWSFPSTGWARTSRAVAAPISHRLSRQTWGLSSTHTSLLCPSKGRFGTATRGGCKSLSRGGVLLKINHHDLGSSRSR